MGWIVRRSFHNSSNLKVVGSYSLEVYSLPLGRDCFLDIAFVINPLSGGRTRLSKWTPKAEEWKQMIRRTMSVESVASSDECVYWSQPRRSGYLLGAGRGSRGSFRGKSALPPATNPVVRLLRLRDAPTFTERKRGSGRKIESLGAQRETGFGPFIVAQTATCPGRWAAEDQKFQRPATAMLPAPNPVGLCGYSAQNRPHGSLHAPREGGSSPAQARAPSSRSPRSRWLDTES